MPAGHPNGISEHHKSTVMKKANEGGQKPFFAAFLEAQDKLSKEEQQTVQGGMTLKYPSDKEDGIGGVTSPAKDGYQTQKYPSDGDDDL